MALIDEINLMAREIHTDGYPMSIGEIASLYKDKELDIHPEFQRIFRWTLLQKSKLIESILLGIPIPSIFVSQRDDGVWDVVDGLQRLSTIFEFMGILRNENDEMLPMSKLVGTDYLPSLAGKCWESDDNDSIDNSLRIEFKRVKIDIKIVKKQSDKNIKFELFQRINTLGTSLSDQEVRNCLLIMINKDFYSWIKRLSNHDSFINSISLADRLTDEQYHIELALRFFIYKNIHLDEIKGVYDLADFVTKKMIFYADPANFEVEKEENIFKNTFDFLYENVGDDAFKRYNSSKTRFEGKFLLSAFECIAVGVGKNIDKIKDIRNSEKIYTKIISIWGNPDFQSRSGSGVSVSSRLPVVIPLGESLFNL
jgi:hypothetical protein